MSEAKALKDSLDIPENSVVVKCTAPVNIAVIKYWGKRPGNLNVPINSSISATLDQDSIRSETIVIASKAFKEDSIQLNDKKAEVTKRMQIVIGLLRAKAQDYKENGQVVIKKTEWKDYKLRIVARNNFPTAAGLASSASGLACFTTCLATLYGVKESFPGELTTVARQGSGSACRSMYGGFVAWRMGNKADGKDSIAQQVVPESHWPDMRILVLVASAKKKDTSSTEGMQDTVRTSPLTAFRASSVVPQRMVEMEKAIKDRNFPKFGELTMKDSNQFHAVCVDTFPPIFYMNETSHRAIRIVDAFNKEHKEIKAAYTFDAGPNAVVFVLKQNMEELLSLFLHYFQPQQADMPLKSFVSDPVGLTSFDGVAQYAQKKSDPSSLSYRVVNSLKPRNPVFDVLSNIYVCKVNDGPRVVSRLSTFGGAAGAAAAAKAPKSKL